MGRWLLRRQSADVYLGSGRLLHASPCKHKGVRARGSSSGERGACPCSCHPRAGSRETAVKLWPLPCWEVEPGLQGARPRGLPVSAGSVRVQMPSGTCFPSSRHPTQRPPTALLARPPPVPGRLPLSTGGPLCCQGGPGCLSRSALCYRRG